MRRTILLLAAAILGIVSLPISSHVEAQSDSKPALDRYGDPLPRGASMRLGTVAFRQRCGFSSIDRTPDGKFIAVPDDDFVNLWETATGKIARRFRHDCPEKGSDWHYSIVRISPDGEMVAAIGEAREYVPGGWTFRAPKRLLIWNLATGEFLREIDRDDIDVFAFCDGGRIAVHHRANVTLWDIATGRRIAETAGMVGRVSSLTFLPKRNTIVINADSEIVLWNLEHPAAVETLPHSESRTRSIASPTGNVFAISGSSLSVRDGATGKSIAELYPKGRADYKHFDAKLAFSADGSLLAAGGDGNRLEIWEVATGKKRIRFPRVSGTAPVLFLPDDRTIVSGVRGCTVQFWDATSGERLRPDDGHEEPVLSIAFSPGGTRLASTSYDRQVRIWDVANGAELQRFDSSLRSPIAWSADGSEIAMIGPTSVSIRDSTTGKEDYRLDRKLVEENKDSPVYSIVFAADGAALHLSTRNSSSNSWNPKTGTVAKIRPPSGAYSMLGLRGGRQLLLNGEKDDAGQSVFLLDIGSNRNLDMPGLNGWAGPIAVSPNEERIAGGTGRSRMRRIVKSKADPADSQDRQSCGRDGTADRGPNGR